MKTSFVMYADYKDSLSDMTIEELGYIFAAILNYVNDENEPEGMDDKAKIAFKFISKQIDRDAEKYEKRANARRKNPEPLGISTSNAQKKFNSGSKVLYTDTPNAQRNLNEIIESQNNTLKNSDKSLASDDVPVDVSVDVPVNDDVKRKDIYTPEIVKPDSESPKKKHMEEAEEVIDYLNEKTGSRYRYSNSSMRHVIARLNEGFTVADCKDVIDKKCTDWLNDSKMQEYLRPETLFGSKFESYLSRPVQQEKAFNDDLPF